MVFILKGLTSFCSIFFLHQVGLSGKFVLLRVSLECSCQRLLMLSERCTRACPCNLILFTRIDWSSTKPQYQRSAFLCGWLCLVNYLLRIDWSGLVWLVMLYVQCVMLWVRVCSTCSFNAHSVPNVYLPWLDGWELNSVPNLLVLIPDNGSCLRCVKK